MDKDKQIMYDMLFGKTFYFCDNCLLVYTPSEINTEHPICDKCGGDLVDEDSKDKTRAFDFIR